MRTLVTGASGFIGSHMMIDQKGKHEVVGVVRDFISSKWLNNALSNTTLVRGDLTDFNFIKRTLVDYQIDTVIHLAATSIVKTAHKDPINTYMSNVMGTVNLLEACRQTDVDKTLILLTDKLFGDKEDAIPEDVYEPTEPYSASKICQDIVARSYERTYGMNIIRTRSCNVYGLDYNNRIVPNTIRAILRDIPPVIYSGENTQRQYIYVEDLISAINLLLNTQKTGPFNVATEDILTQEEVVLGILEVAGSLLIPEYKERQAPLEIQKQSLKISEFGWKPKFTFDEGIEKTISLFRHFGY